MQQSICLNMIVRDEEHVIESTLANILENIPVTTWIISDTGSTDNTKEKIITFFKERDLPGEIFDDIWKDFGHNRSEALKHAYNKSDYLIIFDADDSFTGNFALPESLTHDGYHLTFGSSHFAYKRVLMLNNRKRWKFEGVLHEYVMPVDHAPSYGNIYGDYHIESGKSGARSKDPDRYKKDATILEKAYYETKEEGDRIYTRYGYYCAQSYKDAGMVDDAVKWYKINLQDNGFDQEKAVSCIALGDIYIDKGDIAGAIYYWCKSLEIDNDRLDGIAKIIAYYGDNDKFNMVINYYMMIIDQLDRDIDTNSKLFVNRNAYTYEIAFKVTVAAFYSVKPAIAIRAYRQLLSNIQFIPSHMLDTIFNNMTFYKTHIDSEGSDLIQLILESIKYVHTKHPGLLEYDSMVNLYTSINDSLCIYKQYPKDIVSQLSEKRPGDNDFETVFTITTCKRLDLFASTMNSFLRNCQDISKISYFICVDDNSSTEDRKVMERLYPFMDFIMKKPSEKGHRASMNMLWNKLSQLNPTYWLHMEDDWLFIKHDKYIERSIHILDNLASSNVSQILFNKNYAEEFSDNALLGGGRIIDGDTLLHIHNEINLSVPNSAYWPNYSFRPSLMKWNTILTLGNYDSENQFFERDYADKYTSAGFRSAFFNEITCLHTGKLTRERNDASRKNAYQLNDVNQFEPSESTVKVINLGRRPDRKQKMIERLAAIGLTDYEFVNAMDGRRLSPTKELSELFVKNNFENRRGIIGCALSHYCMWQEFLANSKRDFIVIVEDDINFTPKFVDSLSKLSNGMLVNDIVFLGYTMHNSEREACSDIYNNMTNSLAIHDLNKDLYIGGCFAYSINKNGAKVMIDRIAEYGITAGIDGLIRESPNIVLKECRPQIAFTDWWHGQDNFDTDIQTDFDNIDLDMILRNDDAEETKM